MASRPLDPQGSPYTKVLICTALREVVVVIISVVIIAIILFQMRKLGLGELNQFFPGHSQEPNMGPEPTTLYKDCRQECCSSGRRNHS